MTLRRAFWALPLAVSVAVLAHFVVFGTGHAPGAEHAPELLGALGAMLGLGVFGAFLGGVFGLRRPSIATEPSLRYGPLLLALAATGTFGLIELSEGHLAWRPWLEALLASLPLALAAIAIARATGRVAHGAGASLAALFDRTMPARSRAFIFLGASTRAFAPALARSARRGRAPPQHI